MAEGCFYYFPREAGPFSRPVTESASKPMNCYIRPFQTPQKHKHGHIRDCFPVIAQGIKKELDSNHVLSRKRRTTKGNSVGGGRYSRGALYAILQNPIYIGKIRHKDKIYEGQHEAIIPEDLWNDVQELLKNGSGITRGISKPQQTNLLKGILFDCDGTRYSPVRAHGQTRGPLLYLPKTVIMIRSILLPTNSATLSAASYGGTSILTECRSRVLPLARACQNPASGRSSWVVLRP